MYIYIYVYIYVYFFNCFRSECRCTVNCWVKGFSSVLASSSQYLQLDVCSGLHKVRISAHPLILPHPCSIALTDTLTLDYTDSRLGRVPSAPLRSTCSRKSSSPLIFPSPCSIALTVTPNLNYTDSRLGRVLAAPSR